MGGAIVVLQKIPYLGLTGDVPGGILVDLDMQNVGDLSSLLLSRIVKYCRERDMVKLTLHMRIPKLFEQSRTPYVLPIQGALEGAGFEQSQDSLGTFLQKIDLTDELLLNSYRPRVRRDVRRAQREGVLVQSTSREDRLSGFHEDYRKLFLRKRLECMPPGFFSHGMAKALENGSARLFFSVQQGVILNYALVSTVGLPRYLFGASTDASRAKDRPPGGQILHHEIMRYFRDRGFKWYDWGGSPGPVPVRGHPNYGVWRFKAAFGGTYVTQLGHWSLLLRPWRYHLWRGVAEPSARYAHSILRKINAMREKSANCS
jgi:hypothetical protein